MKKKLLKISAALGGAIATSAFASTSGAEGEVSGLLIWSFVGFGAVVIILQALPAVAMFWGMLKGIFSHTDHGATISKP